MSKVTMRDTKEVILNYVKELEEKLATKEAMTFDPAKEKANTEKKVIKEKAEKIIGMNILNQEIVDGYNAVKSELEAKKAELKTLYEIEANANTLAALIEATDIEKAELAEAKETLIAEKKAELTALEAEYKAKKDSLIEEHNRLIAAKKTERQREEEEYSYNLKRNRTKENDAWEDEKTEIEKALAERENAVKEKENDLEAKKDEIDDLRALVESIPEKITAAQKEAADAKEAEMKRIAAIKEASIKKEIELDKVLLQKEIDSITASLEKVNNENEELKAKLEKAYTQINELATKTVQASQPIYKTNNDSSK